MNVRFEPENLSIEDKAAQLVFPRLGSNMPPPKSADDDVERFAHLVERYPFGGLILFNGDARTTPGMLRDLQHRSRFPLLVATDMEAGVGQQLAGATLFPHAMAFSRAGDEAEELVASAARVAAREALSAGVHIALAPVADVHRNARNPIISIRAFSSEPDVASRLAAVYVRTLAAEGLLSTAKHFPGHGGTVDDSHAVLPVVGDRRSVLERTDLVPFRSCIEAGVDLVMTAHVAYPGLDGMVRPATLSPPILQGLLREELRFEGVVMSDSMTMEGVLTQGTSPNASLIAAGADIVLDPVDPLKAVDEIAGAVAAGDLEIQVLDAAVHRVHGLRRRILERHGIAAFKDPKTLFPKLRFGAASHRAVADRAADAAVTVSRDDHPHFRTLRSRGATIAVAIVPSLRSAGLSASLEEEIRRLAPEVMIIPVLPDAGDDAASGSLLAEAELRVYVLLVRPAAWHAYGLTQHQERLVREGLRTAPGVLAVLGSSDLIRQFPGADPTVCLHSDMPPSQRALARFLFAASASAR